MKTNFTRSGNKKNSLLILLIIAALAVFSSCSMVENVTLADTKKNGSIRKGRDVKIYPDLVKKVMHVKSIEPAVLDFFVFDLEGTLVRHFKMQDGDHKKISNLEKGTYMYQVFKGDEMSESGKLKIK
jgi:hypothetical protein